VEIKFTRLEDGTAEEYEYLETLDHRLNDTLLDDLVEVFKTTDRDTGYPLSPMRHALQTATRAWRGGADEEMIVAALFHDIGDRLSPANHAQVAADILRPYVSERTYWIVAHHAVFQGYYFWHHTGKNRHERDRYRGHPHFDGCVEFCESWDQVSFDPAYDTLPLEAFMPMARRVFGREPFSVWPRRATVI
jgi:predicted HD phosphohydrolase